jgi:hypothetical protein
LYDNLNNFDPSHTNKGKLNDFVAELLDYFYYLHDIFNLGIETLSELLSDHLLQYLLLPQFVSSLALDNMELEVSKPLWVSNGFIGSVESFSGYVFVDPSVLYFYLQAIDQYTGGSSVTSITDKLFSASCDATSCTTCSFNQSSIYSKSALFGAKSPYAKDTSKSRIWVTHTFLIELKVFRNKYYGVLLSFIDDDDRIVLASIGIFYSLVKNPGIPLLLLLITIVAIDQFLLEIGGIYPYRLSKAKKLLVLRYSG